MLWQSVPYLFADFWQLTRAGRQGAIAEKVVDSRSLPYRACLYLLVLNGRARLVGARYRNPIWVACLLIATLIFFLLAGCFEIHSHLAG